jgi:hypothetical protein
MRTTIVLFVFIALATTARAEPIDHSTELPAPLARDGLRVEPSLALVIGAGTAATGNASVAPTARVGYEIIRGHVGLEAGGMARFTNWSLNAMSGASAWTFETHAYGRAALHVGRVAAHVGLSLGLDANRTHFANDTTTHAVGLGANLDAGAAIGLSRTLALALDFTFHPATDRVEAFPVHYDYGIDGSISYTAITVGLALRL